MIEKHKPALMAIDSFVRCDNIGARHNPRRFRLRSRHANSGLVCHGLSRRRNFYAADELSRYEEIAIAMGFLGGLGAGQTQELTSIRQVTC